MKKSINSQYVAGQMVVLTNYACGWNEGTVVSVVTGKKLRDNRIEVEDMNGIRRKVYSKYLDVE